MLGVELAGCGVGGRRVQQVAVFGDEQHDQPVGDAQQRAVQVAVGIGCGSEGFAQRGVGGVGEKPVPNCCSAAATPCGSVSRARAPSSMAVSRHCSSQQFASLGVGVSSWSPVSSSWSVSVRCRRGGLVGPGLESAGVDGEEEQPKVGVELVGEDGVEVELDEGLATENVFGKRAARLRD